MNIYSQLLSNLRLFLTTQFRNFFKQKHQNLDGKCSKNRVCRQWRKHHTKIISQAVGPALLRRCYRIFAKVSRG